MGIVQISSSARTLDEDEKTTMQIKHTGSNGKSIQLLVNESGLYSLIFKSIKPEAREFKRWITHSFLLSENTVLI